ncbi:MAG: glycoside hydrolase family 10 protein [Limisphaerales bacterium]
MRIAALLFVFFLGLLSARGTTNASVGPAPIPPKVQREFRGAWIAVVSNIDWPSKPGLPVVEQKAELKALIEKAAELRLNALFFQVRPACDAVYRSMFEPWSEFLTGEMGKAPDPAWDPLDFAIREAHARGIELHAWFNPYRAGFIGTKHVSPRHIRKKQPKLVRSYGKYYWLDPGDAAVQNYTTQVIMDVVRRYDIDGVHLDDYFYPYPESGDFPDQVSWSRYKNGGGKMEKSDWRRENVNKLVRRLQSEIAKQKAWVTFGISPFGIWRPKYPAQIRGFDAYEGLYADARLWLANGWVDYMSPQLYWAIDAPEQSYPVLLTWWQQQSAMGRPIWPGGAITRAERWGPEEIVRQIEYTRQLGTPGYVHWNLSSLGKNTNLQKEMLKVYAGPALVPGNPGDGGKVVKPTVTGDKKTGDQHLVRWSVPSSQTLSAWVLQVKRGEKWETRKLPASTKAELINMKNVSAVMVTAVSRFRNESEPARYVP